MGDVLDAIGRNFYSAIDGITTFRNVSKVGMRWSNAKDGVIVKNDRLTLSEYVNISLYCHFVFRFNFNQNAFVFFTFKTIKFIPVIIELI